MADLKNVAEQKKPAKQCEIPFDLSFPTKADLSQRGTATSLDLSLRKHTDQSQAKQSRPIAIAAKAQMFLRPVNNKSSLPQFMMGLYPDKAIVRENIIKLKIYLTQLTS